MSNSQMKVIHAWWDDKHDAHDLDRGQTHYGRKNIFHKSGQTELEPAPIPRFSNEHKIGSVGSTLPNPLAMQSLDAWYATNPNSEK